jgi:hypothetical protein
LANSLMRLLLRSPLGSRMRGQFMVLRFSGRKTGRRYELPVTAHRVAGDLFALTDASWRANFRDGADVEVLLDGRLTRIRGYLIEEPEIVAPIYARVIEQLGVKAAQRMMGVKIHTQGTPTTEELAAAARRYQMSAMVRRG